MSMPYTDEQLRSIEHRDGHSLTFAVPGSGKTHTMVGRVRYLLEFCGPLLPAKAAARESDALRDLQDALGHWNDLIVAQAWLATLPRVTWLPFSRCFQLPNITATSQAL
jgi:hypothetical protein